MIGRRIAIVVALASTLTLPGLSSGSSASVPTATCLGRVATIVGTADAEVLRGTPGDDVIAALGGDDRVFGDGGDDVICGGRAGDELHGGPGDDTLDGGHGTDRLVGGPDHNTLLGGGAPLSPPFQTLRVDSALYGWSSSPVAANLRVGTARTRTSLDVLAGIARVVGTTHNDTMLGSDDATSYLIGGRGNDLLRAGSAGAGLDGNGGDDRLLGSVGDDGLAGEGGDDILLGGLGDDGYSGGAGDDIERDSGGASEVGGDLGSNTISLADGDDHVELFQRGRSIVHTGKGDDYVLTAQSTAFTGSGDDVVRLSVPAFDPSRAVADLYLGPGNDLVMYGAGLPRTFSVHAGGGYDEFDNSGDGTDDTYEVSLGPSGRFTQPFTGPLTSVEAYASYSYRVTNLITGSDGPDFIYIDSASPDDRVWGMGGDDQIRAYDMADGAVDGGDGFDACVDWERQLNCEKGSD